MQLKHIPMDGPQNFRDVGGFLNKRGQMIAWNRLYRADGLDRLSDRDLEWLRRLNVRTIVDLRGEAEQRMRPDVAVEGIAVYSCPMMKEEITSDAQAADHSFARSLLTGYQTMVKSGPELIGRAAATVMERLKEGAVVFHCTAGKDRTGILAAVLLLLLDAYEEDIMADYQVSHTYNERGINRMVEHSPKLKEFIEQAGEDSMLHSHPRNIRAVLRLIGENGIQEWLEQAGVDRQLQESFCAEMLSDV